MAALTADNLENGPWAQGNSYGFPVAASTQIFAGAMICINPAGYAIPADDTAGNSAVIGVSLLGVDNSSGANGDKTVNVRIGESILVNTAGGNAIVQADLGKTAYVESDQDVVKSAGAPSGTVAGIVIEIVSATRVRIITQGA